MRNTPSVAIADHSSPDGRVGHQLAVRAQQRRRIGERRWPEALDDAVVVEVGQRRVEHLEQRHLVLVGAGHAGVRRPRCPRRPRRAAAACNTSPSTTGCQASAAMPGVEFVADVGLGRQDLLGRERLQRLDVAGVERRDGRAVRCATFAARSRVLTHAPAPLCAIALWNKPRAAGSAEQRADAVRARRLAEDRDVVGIAAEPGDAVAHPLERGDLVEDARVARARERRRRTRRRGAGTRTGRGGS